MSSKFVLRELPGVDALEQQVRAMERHPHPSWSPEADGLEDHVDRLSRRLFGLGLEDMEDWEPEPEQNLDFVQEFAGHFGWDLTDAAGRRLRCVPYLAAPIIYASRGLRGHLPDASIAEPMSDSEAASVEARLRAEAAKFRSRR